MEIAIQTTSRSTASSVKSATRSIAVPPQPQFPADDVIGRIARVFARTYLQTIASWLQQVSENERGAFGRMLQSILVFDNRFDGASRRPSTAGSRPSTASSLRSTTTPQRDIPPYESSLQRPATSKFTYSGPKSMRLSRTPTDRPATTTTGLTTSTTHLGLYGSARFSEYGKNFQGDELPGYASPRLPDDLYLSTSFFSEKKMPMIEAWLAQAPRLERSLFHHMMKMLSRYAARVGSAPAMVASLTYRTLYQTTIGDK
eukprot:TRINITY_DN14064_c0_g1_i1.p1 TRINITY_DN14064_c0_g1~~TRINITY_DN14064_c0_g1_i1.p1  ORF type:complete len:258 (-),score=43.01 TRINITY_DN14064_c0_g1_i1:145-918(-)